MSAGERIRVIIVDDHSIVRVGLQQVLEQSGEFEVVGQASDGEEAVRAAADVSPDVVVMDVMMPKKDGVEACREIMASAPETRVLMLTASTEEDAVLEAVAAGATGYLQKETGREQLLSAMRNVAQGNLRLPTGSVTPNPPKDTDGRREDSGRGVRELPGRWPGLHWGRWEVGGRSSVAAQGPYGRLRELRCAGWRENTQQGTLADRGGASLRGRWVSRRLAVRPGVEWLAAGPRRE